MTGLDYAPSLTFASFPIPSLGCQANQAPYPAHPVLLASPLVDM